MPQAQYQLGIDLGTTYSVAAVCRGVDKPEVVPLGGMSAPVASVVFLAPDGSLVSGDAAVRRAVTDPRRVAREFKRRIGDGTPVVVGGRPVPADEIAARFVAWMVAQVAEREGGPASRIALTHPAEWGPHKQTALADALVAQGLDDVEFLSEPQAAAIGYASTERVEPGAVVGIYDLGGGTFDAAVVRKLVGGGFEMLGRPIGIERLGGVDFDEAVFEHVRDAIGEAWQELDPAEPAVQSAVAGLRRECTAAKEALSADTEVMIPVMLPGIHTQVRLGRTEFEDMIRPAVAETIEALQRAIVGSGVSTDALDAVLLVGGSSRIPLVAQLVSAELGRSIAVDADPKAVIATGAALSARGPVEPDAAAMVALVPDHPGELLDGPPPNPRQELGPVFVEPAPEPRRYGRTLLVAAALAVVSTLGLAVTTATGVGPLAGITTPGNQAAADPVLADSGAGTSGIDPWTGTTRTATTLPGPQRPAAVAAAFQPAARTESTGAAGASPATPAVSTNPAASGGTETPQGPTTGGPTGRTSPGSTGTPPTDTGTPPTTTAPPTNTTPTSNSTTPPTGTGTGTPASA